MSERAPISPLIAEIQAAACSYFGVSLIDMLSARRDRATARPRQVAMYLAREMTSRSLPEIGCRFGGRDHTTILHGARQIERLIETDPALSAAVDVAWRWAEDLASRRETEAA